MMPECQNCWDKNPKTAVFLGEHEYPALCAEHLENLKQRIAAVDTLSNADGSNLTGGHDVKGE